MEYTEFTAGGGRCVITLPVFLGEDDACRMNDFYASALDAMWKYGCSDEGRTYSGFFCRPYVEEEDGILTVTLALTYRRTGASSLRKKVVHRWRGGFLLR